uniref:Uncharacterized protein n=1 Tax=Lepeophtheirus salmonis TaxID=72036 RepID=A0A0K2U392_LEPSM
MEHDYTDVPDPKCSIVIFDYKRVVITYVAGFVVKKL